MAINIPRGSSDEVIEKIIEVLRAYQTDHPRAEIDLYRQNSVSVRVRVVDPDFAGLEKPDRHQQVWRYLNRMPEDMQSDISTLVLVTEEEKEKSFGNLEFEHPVPSRL